MERSVSSLHSNAVKAIRIEHYGGPETVCLADVPSRPPEVNELRLRVRAAAVNPLDWKIRSGDMRFVFRTRLPHVLGCEVCGEVLEAGEQCRRLAAGDVVFGPLPPKHGGAFAEEVTADEDLFIEKPDGVEPADVVGLPIAGLTAYQPLRREQQRRQERSWRALIVGASGGVGHYAVQLARELGAQSVDAVCGPDNVDWVGELGADRVIDYSRHDFRTLGETWDVIYDTVAVSSYGKTWRVLNRGGCYYNPLPNAVLVAQRLLTRFVGTRRAYPVMLANDRNDLAAVVDLVARGRLRTVVEQTFGLEQVPEALARSESGHAKGKLIVALA